MFYSKVKSNKYIYKVTFNFLFGFLKFVSHVLLDITYGYSYKYTSEVKYKSEYSPVSKVNIGTNHAS